MSFTYSDLYTLVNKELSKNSAFPNGTITGSKQLDRSQVVNGVSTNTAQAIVDVSNITNLIMELMLNTVPPQIKSGLTVKATSPISSRVTVEAGEGTVGGKIFTLLDGVILPVPLSTGESIYYINFGSDGLNISKAPIHGKLTIAKIVVPKPGSTMSIRDSKNIENYPWDAWIVNFKEIKLFGDGQDKFEEDTKELLRDNIGDILADNLIGNIRLSEDLKITNTQGTLELDSKAIKLYDTDINKMAEFNRRGTFFYDTSGREIAKFAVDGAKVGNISIYKNSIQSGNYVSGNLGAGFQITDAGDAEFNNIRARGKLTSSVFEKETVSAVGGNLLVTDADVLDANMSALDSSTLTISGDTTFAVGDILRIKDGTDDEWFEVTNISSAPIYTVTRDKGSSYTSDLNPEWKKGTAVVNYGASGKGAIYMTSSESNSPYLSIFTHEGEPWSSLDNHVRMGNLNGFLDYTTDLYGIGIGCSDAYLKYDPTNGLRIKGDITITGGNASVTFYQATEPGSSGDLNVPKEGDFWIDTDDNNKLYVYDSGAWTLTASTGATTFRQSATQSGEGVPTALNAGDLWIDTDTSKLYRATNAGDDEIKVGEWEVQQEAIYSPEESGLYLGSNYMGFYCAESGYNCWTAYISGEGAVRFGSQDSYMAYDSNTDLFGIYSEYAGACVQIQRGQIEANSIKLTDPACDCNYSYLDAGNWYFHDTMGNSTPYVKRIQSGSVTSGSTVCLPYWSSEPKIQVGIQQLLSFNSSYSTSCQQWRVYYDNLESYFDSGNEWGWKFDVCAILQKSEGEYPECIVNLPLTCCCTGHDDACYTTIKTCFQLWKTDDCVDHCFCYGVLCYRVWWRNVDSGSNWHCCDRCYEQPHTTSTELKTTQYQCTDVCMGANGEYEYYVECLSLTWCCSTLGQSSEEVLCRCIGNMDTGLTCAVYFVPTGYPNYHDTVSESDNDSSTVACTNPDNVFCAYVCYCLTGQTNIGFSQANGGSACICSSVNFTLSGISIASHLNRRCFTGSGTTNIALNDNCCIDLTAYSACNITGACIVSYVYEDIYNGPYTYTSCLCACATARGYILTDTYLVQCYNSFGCNLTCTEMGWYSYQDTSGDLTILDTEGCLNWSAVAYH